jgi:hypothetical protein
MAEQVTKIPRRDAADFVSPQRGASARHPPNRLLKNRDVCHRQP